MSSQIRHATLIPHSDKYSVLSECHNDGSDMDYNYKGFLLFDSQSVECFS